MYVPPPPVVPVTPRRRGILAGGPILAVCCLGIILFLIASTIVLALIPVYLPTRNTNLGGTTQTFFFLLTPNVTLGDDGTLSPAAEAAIANAISAQLGFVPSSLQFDGNIVVATKSSKRRRRGFGLTRNERAQNRQQCYGRGRFLRQFCKQCVITKFVFTIVVVFFYGGILQVVEFLVTIFLISFPFPATLSSSTTTTSSTASAITTTAAIG